MSKPVLYIIIAVIVLGLFFGLGIWAASDSDDEEKVDKFESDPNNPFNIGTYKPKFTTDGKVLVSSIANVKAVYAKLKIELLEKGDTDEQAVVNSFKVLSAKDDVYGVALLYNSLHNRSLWSDLKHSLNDEEQAKVVKFVKALKAHYK